MRPFLDLIPIGLNLPILITVLLILFALYLVRRVRAFVTTVVLAPVAALLVFFGAVALFLWPLVAPLARRIFGGLSGTLATRLEAMAGRGGSLLCRGHREAVARSLWNENQFPFLYHPVPEDLRRPLYEDGKLIGGIELTWLADRHMTRMAFASAIGAGLTAGLILLLPPVFRLVVVTSTSSSSIFHALTLSRPVLEQWPGHAALLAPSSWWWDTAGSDIERFVTTAGAIILDSFAGWLMIAVGGALLTAFAALRLWQWTKSTPYTFITKDADVRWSYRIEAREISNATYRRQVGLCETYLAGSPLYRIGQSTGSSRLRGDLSAPTRGQPLCLDRDSLFQHLLVLGGTGEGKTTAILKPLMRQLMVDPRHGFYVCDAKGVLWADALKVAEACGRADQVSIIGTGEGQFGVDPLANLNPTQVAATLRSVLKQISGGASDNFWPEMAANILRHVLTLALTYKLTVEGQEDSMRGIEPYSLWWAYQAVLDKTILAHVVVCIREYSQSVDAEFNAVLERATSEDEVIAESKSRDEKIPPETHASILYVETAWTTMAEETKSGIVANVTQLLDGFAGARTLRERFACGRSGAGTINMAAALEGRIVLNALSSIEDGLPARLVLVLLKTSLYREARRREATFKAATPRRNPQEHPCIVFMDEVQEIATSDPESGLSDATFWNVARSTGLAGIFATQTLAALNQALGDRAAANFIQQARSKVFFRSEDTQTIEYACWCAGSHERNRVYEDWHRESIDHRHILDGWEPFAPIDETEQVAAGAPLFWSAASSLLTSARGRIAVAQRQKAYVPDLSFAGRLPKDPNNTAAAETTAIQMERDAVWRAEDLERSYRTDGNDVCPALSATDVINMGRWHAFAHIQRAGAVRQDIVTVEHDYA